MTDCIHLDDLNDSNHEKSDNSNDSEVDVVSGDSNRSKSFDHSEDSEDTNSNYPENEYAIAEYDLNGERDFMCFNITEYQNPDSNRIGSQHDGLLLEQTFREKGFEIKAFRNGELYTKTIISDLKIYVNEVVSNKRDVKILAIAFMAHGGEDDRIIFSDESSYKYKSLLKIIFDCERQGSVVYE